MTDPQSPSERSHEQLPTPEKWIPPVPSPSPIHPDDFQRPPLDEGHQRSEPEQPSD